MTSNDRDNNICEICAVLADWGTSVVLLVSMKMVGYFWFGIHITINLIAMKMDGGSHGFNNILFIEIRTVYARHISTCRIESASL